jgi:hypothetical protein
MDIPKIRHQLFRIVAQMTVSEELRDEHDWDENEIDEIKGIMASIYDDRSGELFYRNGGLLLLSYLIVDHFIKNIPLDTLGMAFILYGAI